MLRCGEEKCSLVSGLPLSRGPCLTGQVSQFLCFAFLLVCSAGQAGWCGLELGRPLPGQVGSGGTFPLGRALSRIEYFRRVLFPPSAESPRAFFSLILWEPDGTPGGEFHSVGGAPHDWVPWSFWFSDLASRSLQQSLTAVRFSCPGWPALPGRATAGTKHLPVTPPVLGSGLPYVSLPYRSKKNCWFFGLFSLF